MASDPLSVLWSLVEHAGHRAIDHGANWADRAAGFKPPSIAPQLPPPPAVPHVPSLKEIMGETGAPAVPEIPKMPSMPALPMIAPAEAVAGGAIGVLAAEGSGQKTGNRARRTEDALGAFDPPSAIDPSSGLPYRTPEGALRGGAGDYDSYAADVTAGAACLNCTRGHLSAMRAAATAARDAQARGDDEEARRQLVLVAEEAAVLREFDWSPKLLARTPPEDLAIVQAVAPCVDRVEALLPVPRPVALAAGSVKEARRFALSRQPTERDRQEIERRLRAADAAGALAERSLLATATGDAATSAAAALREGRHYLDRGDPFAADTLAAAGAQLDAAAQALTPLPDADTLAGIARECHACAETFYGRYFEALRRRKALPA